MRNIKKYHTNGNIVEDYWFDEITGKNHGVYKCFHSDGQLYVIYEYDQGNVNGPSLSWDTSGQKLTEYHYRYGRLHGKCIVYNNGIKSREGDYIDDHCRSSVEWFSNEIKSSEINYITSELSEQTKWNKEGIKLRDIKYDKQKIMFIRDYYENGNKLSEQIFEHSGDNLIITSTYYNEEDGSVKSIGKNNNYDLSGTFCDKKGRLVVLANGDITGYKACKLTDGTFVIVELQIPADAERICAFTGEDIARDLFKCRSSHAIVKKITDEKGKEYTSALSFVYNCNKIEYVVDQKVIPDGFDNNKKNTCGKGINFHRWSDECLFWKETS